MSKQSTALDSPRLTASQRARLIAAGRRLAKETEQAERVFERKIAPHEAQLKRTLAAAEEAHDQAVAEILGELNDGAGASS